MKVNTKTVTKLGTKVRPKIDIITVDGKKVKLLDQKEIFWVAFHKPKSVITTMEDDKSSIANRVTIASLIPKAKELHLIPVGRMERESTGLLLLTNDVGWIHPLTHNSFEKYRRYHAVVKGIPSEDDISLLKNGINMKNTDGRYKFEKVNVLDVDEKAQVTLLDIVIIESGSMLLQELLEQIKCSVIRTKRIEFGPIKLSTLKKGKWRELTRTEIEKLKRSCKANDRNIAPTKKKANKDDEKRRKIIY